MADWLAIIGGGKALQVLSYILVETDYLIKPLKLTVGRYFLCQLTLCRHCAAFA